MIRRAREIILRVLTTNAAWPILLAVALMCTASIMALRLSAPAAAARQQIHIALGAGIMLLAVIPHYAILGRFSYIIFAAICVVLGGVLVTEKINGAARWFAIGNSFQFQPSELAKIAFVLVIAWYLKYRKDVQEFSGLLIPALIMVIPFGLIIIEPDLGTAMLFPLVLFMMLIAAGAKIQHLLFVILVAAVALMSYYPFMPQYQRSRLTALLPSVQADVSRRQGPDYQAYMSEITIGSGGSTGDPDGVFHLRKGLLPEAHTDFIFACIGAQWGFTGCVLIFLLYLAFFGAATEVAGSTKDPFGRLVVVGLSSMIMLQALINIAMTIRLAPIVGITLPFISYGGSSLLSNMLSVGILLNVSIRRQGRGSLR